MIWCTSTGESNTSCSSFSVTTYYLLVAFVSTANIVILTVTVILLSSKTFFTSLYAIILVSLISSMTVSSATCIITQTLTYPTYLCYCCY